MFTALHAVLLGLIEGVTEFLPISSTGHMILAASALRIPDSEFLKSFEIIVQLGAILAVFTLYWKKLLLNKKIFSRVAVAFVPTAVIGLLLYKLVKQYLLGSTTVVVWALAVGGILLIAFELFRKDAFEPTDATAEIEAMSYKQALGIGLFQAVAIVPGVSRSAATIVGGLLLGLSRGAIVEFSFMLAVPTMAAATLLDVLKSSHSFTGHESGLLVIGLAVSFVSAIFAVKFLLRFVRGHTFIPFGIYRIVIAVAFLLYLV
jgi:undecaprenyl-diphosphatase